VISFNSANLTLAFGTFLLLLIGVGPKIALVPYVQITAGMDASVKARVMRRMLITAALVALLLVILGEFLTRLLHFSTGALSVACGIDRHPRVSLVQRRQRSSGREPDAGHAEGLCLFAGGAGG
jgi:hypothetical protein